MVDQSVLVEVDEAGVALVTLNRPDKLNAFTAEMFHRFCRLLGEADQDPNVRAIVLTGAGRGFCAGADLAALATISDGSFTAGGVDLGIPLGLSTPLIAAANGPVAGMGFSYLLMADVRFAGTDVTLSTTFARLGLVAEWGSAPLLVDIVGRANAADLLLSGRTVGADEAYRLGLVQRVVEPEQTVPQAIAYARDLAQNCSPTSHAVIKAQLRDPSLRAQFDASIELMLASFTRPDLTEALTARTGKRPAHFAPYRGT